METGPEEKKARTSDPLEKDAPMQMQPVEELLSVELFPELFPNKTGFTTRIGT